MSVSMWKLATLGFLFSTVLALPVGNPADASLFRCGVFWDPCGVSPCSPLFAWSDAINVRFGYWGDFVGNRRMIESVYGDQIGVAGKVGIVTNAGLAVVNIANWMDVFATFGTSTIEVFGKGSETQIVRRVSFTPTFSWSVGARVTAYHCGPIYIGGEAQYLRTEPDLSAYYNSGSGVLTQFNNTNPMIWEEWQVGFGLSLQAINALGTSLIPYGAIKFSQGKFWLRSFQFTYDAVQHQLPDLIPEQYFGYAFGVTWLAQQAMGVTLEGRWLDETGVFVSGEFKF